MVTWQVLTTGHEVEVMFETADVNMWQDFQARGYGVAALNELQSSGNGSNAVIDPSQTNRRRHLSLPETYFAVAIDGVLPLDEPLRELWERFNCSSATFVTQFAVFQHFRRLGWTPKPGLNYGAHYVLYRGSATEFHSEYVVYVQDEKEVLSWNTIQSLTRIAADVKKTVLLCTVSTTATMASEESGADVNLTFGVYTFHDVQYTVEAVAIRFWDALIADDPQSYTFQPQPILPKKSKTAKRKNRVKRPKRQLESDALTGSGNST